MAPANHKQTSPGPGQQLLLLGFRLFLRTTSWLPLGLARKIGSGLGALAYPLLKKRSHITRVNIQLCYPDLSAEQQEARAKDCFRHAGMWFMEMGMVWHWPIEKLLARIKVDNPGLLENAIGQSKGVILASPHLGNWEVAGQMISHQHEFACFYKYDDDNPLISDFISKKRARNGAATAPANTRGVRILYKHLKEGKIAGLLPDHIPTDEMGVFALFFGRPALTGTLISSLARKNNAPVLMMSAIRTRHGFTVYYLPVENQTSDDPVLAATAINRVTEEIIALAPAQFQWVYPRFKKRPDPNVQPSPYR